MLKFQESHQCPLCGDLVKEGYNTPANQGIVLEDWSCKSCHEELVKL